MITDADMLPGRLMFKAPLLPLTVGRASVCAPHSPGPATSLCSTITAGSRMGAGSSHVYLTSPSVNFGPASP